MTKYYRVESFVIGINMKNVQPQLVTPATLQERFDFSQYDIIGHLDIHRIIFFDGDAFVAGDLNHEWTVATLQALDGDIDTSNVLIMVNGDCTVEGQIYFGDYHPCMLVLGNVHCNVLVSTDETIHITGDAHIRHVFYGYYNDGSIVIEGTTYVRYVVNSDHHSAIKPEGAVLINIYSDHNDFFEYDYTREVLPDVLDPVIFGNKDGDFDVWKFIDVVVSGRDPFKAGSKPLKALHAEALAALAAGNVADVLELDWRKRKCTAFPLAIAQLKYLKKLDLSENHIPELPAAIGELEQLEELSLHNCGLTTMHEAIGRCKKLRILNLNTNRELMLPEALGELQSLEVLKIDYVASPLPESMARLEKLESINMYSCYTNREQPAPFPEVLTKLKSLKRLDLRENKLQSLPESLVNIQTLEEFLWTGSTTNAATFPDFTRFPNLKKLVISRKFNSWKNRLFDIPSLEHLQIDRNKEDKQVFTQDTLDIWAELAAGKDKGFQQLYQYVLDNRVLESNGSYSCVMTPGMNWEELQPINKLSKLKYLDLSFNNLPALPETFYELKHLEYLDLEYNKFPEEVKARIREAFPGTEIKF